MSSFPPALGAGAIVTSMSARLPSTTDRWIWAGREDVGRFLGNGRRRDDGRRCGWRAREDLGRRRCRRRLDGFSGRLSDAVPCASTGDSIGSGDASSVAGSLGSGLGSETGADSGRRRIVGRRLDRGLGDGRLRGEHRESASAEQHGNSEYTRGEPSHGLAGRSPEHPCSHLLEKSGNRFGSRSSRSHGARARRDEPRSSAADRWAVGCRIAARRFGWVAHARSGRIGSVLRRCRTRRPVQSDQRLPARRRLRAGGLRVGRRIHLERGERDGSVDFSASLTEQVRGGRSRAGHPPAGVSASRRRKPETRDDVQRFPGRFRALVGSRSGRERRGSTSGGPMGMESSSNRRSSRRRTCIPATRSRHLRAQRILARHSGMPMEMSSRSPA